MMELGVGFAAFLLELAWRHTQAIGKRWPATLPDSRPAYIQEAPATPKDSGGQSDGLEEAIFSARTLVY